MTNPEKQRDIRHYPECRSPDRGCGQAGMLQRPGGDGRRHHVAPSCM